MTTYNDNHWKHTNHIEATSRTQYVKSPEKSSLNVNTGNNNKFIPHDEQKSSNKVQHVIKNPVQQIKHPIVNLCQNYIESVFMQYDCFPNTNGTMLFKTHQKGRIVGLKYYLDSSAGDGVIVTIDKISGNGGRKSLIKYSEDGNKFIKGTFNSAVLVFDVNMKIAEGEQIQITFNNTTANDVTIMAIANIKYGEEDFE